ncbi:MAG: PQQ-binding-like beta-propeller repeat protein [Verrucomicrobiota bacterium]
MRNPLPLLAAIFIGISGATISAQEWSRFRGPGGSGISKTATIPAKFTTVDYEWLVALPGVGHSSPVIWGEQLFLTVVTGGTQRQIISYNTEDGSKNWSWESDFVPHNKHRDNEFASSTPCLDQDHLYVFWTSDEQAEAIALTHDGKPAWQKSLGTFAGDHGSATSPILVKGGVFVFWDDLNNTQSEFALLNPADGSEIWRKLIDWDDRQLKSTYSTPVLYLNSKGKEEIIITSQPFGMLSLDPENGDELWRYDHGFKARTVGSPVIAKGVIFATWGSGNGAKDHVAVVPGSETKNGQAKVAWRWDHNKGLPYVPTPLYRDGLLFFLKDDGLLQVVKADTGDIVHGPTRIGGRFFSNPILVDDKIYCGSRDRNEMVVIKASEDYDVIARNQLDSGVNATPAVANGKMFIRTNESLIAIGSH